MNRAHDFDDLIARALRDPRIEAVPQDLVASTLARVEGLPEAAGDRLEKWLQRGLFAALVASAAIALVLLSADAVAKEIAAGQTARWVLVAIACLAASLPVHRWAELHDEPV